MPTANRAYTRYSNRFQRHQAHLQLAVLVRTYGAFTMSQDELFPDIQRTPKRVKTPESGFLNFPATYDPTPVPMTDYAALIDATYGHRPAEKCACGTETDTYTEEGPMCAGCIEKAEPK